MSTWTKHQFGINATGNPVYAYTFTTETLEVVVLEYGLIVQKLVVKSKRGQQDIVLGYDTLSEYENDPYYIGAIIGRNANRIPGVLNIDDKVYNLKTNEGSNQLHGGQTGFDKRIWNCNIRQDELVCTLVSPDGDQGFPGEVTVEVRISVTIKQTDSVLDFQISASTTEATLVNITRHDYFNLVDLAKASALDHHVQINGDKRTLKNEENITTGEVVPVENTPYNFQEETSIEASIKAGSTELVKGFDNNYMLRDTGESLRESAIVFDPVSRRQLKMYTTQPAVQFYTGGHLGTFRGKQGIQYKPYSGLCLETQHVPAAHLYPQFETTVLKPGQVYQHKIQYHIGFRTENDQENT